MTKSFFILIALLFTVFCTGPVQESSNRDSLTLADTLSIQYQDTLYNDENDIWLSFDTVNGDSRCPVNVVCFWAGNASLDFTFSLKGHQIPFQLNTHPSFITDTLVSGYSIRLLGVLPYPHTDSTYTADDYIAKLTILKN